MKIWCFAATSYKNLQIAHEKGLWAVSYNDAATNSARATKARGMTPNSRGILYGSRRTFGGNGFFTMPFRTLSYAEERVVDDVWPGRWWLPFRIYPLGPPSKLVNHACAMRDWAFLEAVTNLTHGINGSAPRTVFVPTEIAAGDWNRILSQLATESDEHFPEPADYVNLRGTEELARYFANFQSLGVPFAKAYELVRTWRVRGTEEESLAAQVWQQCLASSLELPQA